MFEFCRLCIKMCTDHQKLSDENGHPNEVYNIAVKYFSPMLLKMDDKTHVTVICIKCWHHIFDFHSFQESVHEAQRNLAVVNRRSQMAAALSGDDNGGGDINLALDNVEIKIEKEEEEEGEHLVTTLGETVNVNSTTNNFPHTTISTPDNNCKDISNAEDFESLVSPYMVLKSTYSNNNTLEMVKIKDEPMDSISNAGNDMAAITHNDVDHESKKFDELIEILGGVGGAEVDIKPNLEVISEEQISNDGEKTWQDFVKLEEESLTCDMEFITSESEFILDHTNDSNPSTFSNQNSNPKFRSETDTDSEGEATNFHIEGGRTLKQSLRRPQTVEEFDEFISQWRPTLECLICHTVCPSFTLLQEHFKETHSPEKCYIECCEKKFYYRYEIEEHVLYHMEPRIYKCEVCYKCFTVKTSLKEHLLKTHSGRRKEDPFKCPTCGKAHLCKTTLRHHMKFFCGSENRRKDGKHVCNECGKSYLGIKGLKRHINFKHLERKSFKCTICDKAFIDQIDLREHMDSHTGQKSLTCAFCPKKFQYRTVLYHHCLREHRAEYEEKKREKKEQIAQYKNSLTCAFCNKQYAKASSLNTHERAKHFEEYQKRKESGILKCRILSRPS
ncbi:uncharacterized protein LOC142229274 isoform X2 [Haematobia irritans]|uniref:uncharacterized protein LOC142229274 isoform X2 n=1 Tax=Haematobia irritans TaxID=7368 RepID=UPI003F50AE75